MSEDFSEDFGHEDCTVCDAAREAKVHSACQKRIAELEREHDEARSELAEERARVAKLETAIKSALHANGIRAMPNQSEKTLRAAIDEARGTG